MATRFNTIDQMNSDAAQYDSEGVAGTITAGTTGNIDLQLLADYALLGGVCLVKGANWGDHASLQILMGDVVVGQYVSNWYVAEDRQFQFDLTAPFPANLPAGLKLRIAYTSTGATDVKVAINYKLARVII